MTQLMTRRDTPVTAPRENGLLPVLPPPHPHYTLGSVAVIALVAALVAAAIGVGALAITANRNSVDDDLVADRVDEYLAVAGVAGAAAEAVPDVVPELTPRAELAAAPADEIAAAFAPDVPARSERTTPAVVSVHLEIVEEVQTIDPATGTEYETWGFRLADNPGAGLVVGTPGPMIRARVGDMLSLTVTNPADSAHAHNIDLHAVTGPGGGAVDTLVAPGETATIEARMLYPGMFMYHCAYDDVPLHISHGMFGGILVDPAEPLPEVDHEWYIVQSEYYTTPVDGGLADTDRTAVTAEEPSHVVFNGATGAIAGDNALEMAVGERARIYFVNAGLNLASNFHPIGSHWDVVYPEAALLGDPLRGSQTTLVPAGGGTVVEIVGQVPSTLVLVDHALARAFDKGAVGQVVITGEPNPEIYAVIGAEPATDDSHDMSADSDGDADGAAPAAEVSIVAGAGDVAEMDADDEFANSESAPDYSVNTLTVPVGTTVTWTNDDTVIHTVTAADGSFDSGFLDPGATWSYTFDTPGEFEYLCTPHPWMRAKVVVEG